MTQALIFMAYVFLKKRKASCLRVSVFRETTAGQALPFNPFVSLFNINYAGAKGFMR